MTRVQADGFSQTVDRVLRPLEHLKEAPVDMQQHAGDAQRRVLVACLGQQDGQGLIAEFFSCGIVIDKVNESAHGHLDMVESRIAHGAQV